MEISFSVGLSDVLRSSSCNQVKALLSYVMLRISLHLPSSPFRLEICI